MGWATITGGLVAHPIEQATDLLRFYRDLTARAPRELTLYAGLLHAPDGSGAKLAAIAACHCGPPESARAVTRALKRFGSPVLDMIGPMPYSRMNAIMDADFPK